jgi:septin family protein
LSVRLQWTGVIECSWNVCSGQSGLGKSTFINSLFLSNICESTSTPTSTHVKMDKPTMPTVMVGSMNSDRTRRLYGTDSGTKF